MSNYPIDDTQLAIYLTFTLLSIVVSTCFYCVYQHFNTLAEEDFSRLTNFYVSVANRDKEIFSEAESVKSNPKQRLL